jgi:hypothetical protein
VSQNTLEAEKNFTSALISALSGREPPPTESEISDTALKLAELIGFKGETSNAIVQAMIAIDSRMGRGASIIDDEAKHDEEWALKREGINWTYSDAYEAYLRSEGWAAPVIGALSDVGDKILGHLQDPLSEGSWDRRGLVIGHVQSGKTANYMGVIAKAADTGYKFIIVIAGIHNNLRKQTQERIDEGFIGRSSNPENRVKIGVGLFSNSYPHPVTLTNINADFNKAAAEGSGWKINDFSKPVIFVIKKNVSTLKALHKWLKELNAHGDGQISDVPMLMIDDEADNASINTNKPDINPTKTNSWIRQILGLFDKSCYVGYTATPFANIFINPDAYDKEAREELFPRDFIYSLDAPNTYFGPDKVFLNEESSLRVLKKIDDAEAYIPETHNSESVITELPPTLYRAIDQFILARAIRNLRGHETKHASMMINVSRFVTIQKSIRDLVNVYVKKLHDAIKANYAMPEDVSSKNEYMQSLQKVFEQQYSHCEFEWSDIKGKLITVFPNLRTYVVNSKSEDVLDYKKYERDGQSLTAIAVGGLSLSRGLTVEGLTISYMYRNTRMYDTLMQMGRWFGYRPGYEDLCRVHLSPHSITWYRYIAEKSEELRQQIRRMRKANLTPRKFGLYVEAHPDRLMITAANKMRSGTKVTVKQNLSGKLRESYLLPSNEIINGQNEKLIQNFWSGGFGGKKAQPTGKGVFFEDVDVLVIEEFLSQFKTHPSFIGQKAAITGYLNQLTERFHTGDVLLISLSTDQDLENYKLGSQERTCQAIEDGWRTGNYRVASKGDEKLGLPDPKLKEARENAKKENAEENSDFHYRVVRNKPLLMVHVLKVLSNGTVHGRVPAFGVSFPDGDYTETIEVVANTVWLDQMSEGPSDNPDDEDDYDE